MSENEIKPVAWCAIDDMRNEWAFAWSGTGRRPWHDSPLYDQSAIDALTNQISELKTMLSIAEFQRKEMQAERDEANRKLSVAVAEGKALVAAAAEVCAWVKSGNGVPVDIDFVFREQAQKIAADIRRLEAARAEGGV